MVERIIDILNFVHKGNYIKDYDLMEIAIPNTDEYIVVISIIRYDDELRLVTSEDLFYELQTVIEDFMGEYYDVQWDYNR